MAEIQKKFSSVVNQIDFVGKSDNLTKYLSKSSLYLHCARGEAFGISVIEAMAAGVPPIVSEWTGAKEVVSQVSDMLIVPLDQDIILQRVKWYFNLPLEKKIELSDKCRKISREYTQENAVANFQNTIKHIAQDFSLL
jgi:glycosyltransferase involved in cell wall biosynthesis